MVKVGLWKRTRRPSAAQTWQWVESAGRWTPREAAVTRLRRRRWGSASGMMVAGTEAAVQESGCARVGGESAEAEVLCHVVGQQPAGDLLDEVQRKQVGPIPPFLRTVVDLARHRR